MRPASRLQTKMLLVLLLHDVLRAIVKTNTSPQFEVDQPTLGF